MDHIFNIQKEKRFTEQFLTNYFKVKCRKRMQFLFINYNLVLQSNHKEMWGGKYLYFHLQMEEREWKGEQRSFSLNYHIIEKTFFQIICLNNQKSCQIQSCECDKALVLEIAEASAKYGCRRTNPGCKQIINSSSPQIEMPNSKIYILLNNQQKYKFILLSQ